MTERLTGTPAARGVLERYRDRLPVTNDTPMLSLGEGGTPLVSSRRLIEPSHHPRRGMPSGLPEAPASP